MTARHYTLTGRVQGVGFRFFTYQVARELGISGWVRNLPDGRVEIFAQGPEEKVQEFLNRIRSGPRLSVVEDIDIQKVEPDGRLTDFTIEG